MNRDDYGYGTGVFNTTGEDETGASARDLYGEALAHLEGVDIDEDTRSFEDIDFDEPEDVYAKMVDDQEKMAITGEGRERSPFGDFLCGYREKHYLSQHNFAKKCGISLSCVSAMEVGRIHPKRAKSDKIADALGFDKEEFWQRVSFSKCKTTGRSGSGDALMSTSIRIPYNVLEWYKDNAKKRRKTTSLVIVSTLMARYVAETGKTP